MKKLIYLLPSFMLCMACKATKPNSSANKDGVQPFVLKFERGPCFGTCPVYSFYVLSDHTGLVLSKAHLTDTAGWYYANLDQEALAEVLELIEPQQWWNPNLGQQPEISDLPSYYLSYWHKEGLRTLRIHSRTNESLQNVFGKMSDIVTAASWEPTKLRPLEAPEAAQTDVIVQLKEGVDVQKWMKKYERFGIHLKKRITPHQQYYLVSKNPSKGNANDFLQYIKTDEDVVDAQWDRPLNNRN